MACCGHSFQAFADHYYSVFDSNRAGLAPLYQDSSLLTFEGEKFQGTNNIVQKLTSLPFQQVKHLVSTTDAQPSLSGGITVFVTGQLQVSDPFMDQTVTSLTLKSASAALHTFRVLPVQQPRFRKCQLLPGAQVLPCSLPSMAGLLTTCCYAD